VRTTQAVVKYAGDDVAAAVPMTTLIPASTANQMARSNEMRNAAVDHGNAAFFQFLITVFYNLCMIICFIS